jgi:acid phosphatase type 7
VEYGVDGALDQKANTSIDGLIDADDHFQKVGLVKLMPGTQYSYKVVSKEIKTFQV